MMKKSLLITASFFVLGTLWLSPLQAMEEEKENKNKNSKLFRTKSPLNLKLKGIKTSDDHLAVGDENKMFPAVEMRLNLKIQGDLRINNEKIENLCAEIDILKGLVLNDPDSFPGATSYPWIAPTCKDVALEDIRILRDLNLKQGNEKAAAYYNDILSENSSIGRI